jgi:hypothetical protein
MTLLWHTKCSVDTGPKTANQCDQESQNIPSTQAPYYEDVVLKQPEQELELNENVAYAVVSWKWHVCQSSHMFSVAVAVA